MKMYVVNPQYPGFSNYDKFDPQVTGVALERLAKKKLGVFTSEDFVEEAQAKKHPCHLHFEWDNEKAGHQHRLSQARAIIRAVAVEDIEVEGGIAPAFISIHRDSGRRAYYGVGTVKQDLDLQDRLLRQTSGELEQMKRRFRMMADVCQALTEAQDAIEARRRKRVEDRPSV